MSYGTLGWLPDLKTWGAVVAKHLKPGGTFFISEFHPLIDLLDEKTQYGYFFDENTTTTKEVGSYTDGGEDMKTEYCWWSHSLTEIFVALESNGLKLQAFEEKMLRVLQDTLKDNASSGTNGNKKLLTNHAGHSKYCWSHGLCNHTSKECKGKKDGHKEEATCSNRMNGSNKGIKQADR